MFLRTPVALAKANDFLRTASIGHLPAVD